eukprot:Sdes_comp16349_c0_seq1m5706
MSGDLQNEAKLAPAISELLLEKDSQIKRLVENLASQKSELTHLKARFLKYLHMHSGSHTPLKEDMILGRSAHSTNPIPLPAFPLNNVSVGMPAATFERRSSEADVAFHKSMENATSPLCAENNDASASTTPAPLSLEINNGAASDGSMNPGP